MGLTPLDGLMMGTRCGAIDPAIVPFVMEHENLTAAEMNDLMNKKSGLLGISGISNDLRSVRDASEKGDERAMLAYDMYSNSVKKYIGQYIAVMGGVDAIVLTAGVGENCEKMRRMIFTGLQPLGIILDEEKNRQRGFEREISADDSRGEDHHHPHERGVHDRARHLRDRPRADARGRRRVRRGAGAGVGRFLLRAQNLERPRATRGAALVCRAWPSGGAGNPLRSAAPLRIGGGGLQALRYSTAFAWACTQVMAMTPTMSSAEQPRDRSFTGAAMPWVTGPYASARARRCTSL